MTCIWKPKQIPCTICNEYYVDWHVSFQDGTACLLCYPCVIHLILAKQL